MRQVVCLAVLFVVLISCHKQSVRPPEMVDGLQSCRQKCKQVIFSLTEENVQRPWIDQPDDIAGSVTLKYSVLEILLYNLKHLQHHAGQLNLLLREETGQAADWVADVQAL